LGNFIFDYKKKYQQGLWTNGYGVMFYLTKNTVKFELLPYHQGRAENPNLVLLTASEQKFFDEDIRCLNKKILDDTLFYNEWKNYLKTQEKNYKGLLLLQNKYVRASVAKNILPPVFLHSKSHKLLLLNLLRCESHREIMINILSNDNLSKKK
jgi:poly-gamma-glutamate synthesis protein (capsule biosynthesis protein)